MTPNSSIEAVVMRRVHAIRILRAIFSPLTAYGVVFAVTLLGIGRAVWVARIFDNAPHDLLRVPGFFYAAFVNTDVIVELLTIICAFSALALLNSSRRIVRQKLLGAFA